MKTSLLDISFSQIYSLASYISGLNLIQLKEFICISVIQLQSEIFNSLRVDMHMSWKNSSCESSGGESFSEIVYKNYFEFP